jgi:hypothetical protein
MALRQSDPRARALEAHLSINPRDAKSIRVQSLAERNDARRESIEPSSFEF